MSVSFDTEQAMFVQQAHRYVTVFDPAVKARNPAARIVTLDTNLDATSAAALAAKYLAENKKPRVFEIKFKGRLDFSEFEGGPVSYIPDFPKLRTDGRTMKVVSSTIDDEDGTTTVRVRG